MNQFKNIFKQDLSQSFRISKIHLFICNNKQVKYIIKKLNPNLTNNKLHKISISKVEMSLILRNRVQTNKI